MQNLWPTSVSVTVTVTPHAEDCTVLRYEILVRASCQATVAIRSMDSLCLFIPPSSPYIKHVIGRGFGCHLRLFQISFNAAFLKNSAHSTLPSTLTYMLPGALCSNFIVPGRTLPYPRIHHGMFLAFTPTSLHTPQDGTFRPCHRYRGSGHCLSLSSSGIITIVPTPQHLLPQQRHAECE